MFDLNRVYTLGSKFFVEIIEKNDFLSEFLPTLEVKKNLHYSSYQGAWYVCMVGLKSER